ncbi:helix-turn-helix domain-containing protein [Kitasatospora hibisci]|uniref:helix-turn-helix domain-containing protein n=1 Tax=Kitasatospora hibisci TaxID=3369522 RepID=UPI0037543E8E
MVVKKRTALALQRMAAGHSQETLAAAMDVERTTVARWERGKAEPRPWQRPKLAKLLNIGAAELDRLLRLTCEQTAAESPPGPTGQAELQPGPNRRPNGNAVQLADVDTLIGDWAAANSAGHGVGKTPWVTEEEVGVAEGMLAMFRQLDHTHGARHYARQVRDYIDTELDAMLRRPAADDEVARNRARLTAGFCELAGYQAVDTGSPVRAQAYYQRALTLTTATNDQAYGAYLVAVNLGHLALHCGQPEVALRWASSARATAGTAASPATRAAITAVLARANARMQREAEATQLIRQAEELLGAADGDEPTWIRYFTHAYLADEIAHSLHDLGRAPAARTQLTDALQGVGKDKVRRLAIDAALLASTWLRTGDLDQACAVGREAVTYAARTGSGRCIDRVAGVLADLQAHADYAPVRDLREFTRAVLPEADRVAITLSRGA